MFQLDRLAPAAHVDNLGPEHRIALDVVSAGGPQDCGFIERDVALAQPSSGGKMLSGRIRVHIVRLTRFERALARSMRREIAEAESRKSV